MKSQKIFDTFMFYNELDLLEIRLELLYHYVDYFIISECNETFSGKKKEYIFQKNKKRFKKYIDKIVYQKINYIPSTFENFSKPYYTDYLKSYSHKHNGVPLIKLSKSFQREVFQRDSVIEPLLKVANKDDIIIMSDLDEIPNPISLKSAIQYISNNNELVHFEQKWFMYYLNNYCDNKWYGTHICKFSFLLNNSVDLLQYHKEDILKLSGGRVFKDSGWHFSFLGGAQKVKEKLLAYDYQGGKTSFILSLTDRIFPNRLKKKISNNEDIFLSNRIFHKKKLSELFDKNVADVLKIFTNHIKS
jgi:beta-1,4-mannosyl-glycoprotein beta-1,4-N-acetylglucosaminyltransferase